ncbi:4Fe-4S dicluster domain-containing protein, partial [Bacillus nitratireducens]|uniref:4Fe-4S dicluster domain-containing protein n=1 Tax=Bacillus nitratireducens TaxID=2026193 RepID=UPI0028460A9F
PPPLPARIWGIQNCYPDKCIVSNQCSNICPTYCIQLTEKKHPYPTKIGKIIYTYDINFEICILCDLCTEVCPTEAIVMTNNNLQWLDENDENVRKENKA